MLLAAARDLGVRPRGAWMVGDKPSDVETGRAFGCRTAWVGPKAWRKRFAAEVRPLSPDVVADGLLDGAGGLEEAGRNHTRRQWAHLRSEPRSPFLPTHPCRPTPGCATPLPIRGPATEHPRA